MDFHMGTEGEESESATKFDHLVSATELVLDSNSLTRIPSVRKMPRLQTLALPSNKITMIAPGDFLGASSLVYFGIGNNLIVSVAPEAFVDMKSTRVTPAAFKDTNAAVLPVYGIGACPLYDSKHSFLPFLCNIAVTVTDIIGHCRFEIT